MSWLDDELNGTKTKQPSSGASWLDEELSKAPSKNADVSTKKLQEKTPIDQRLNLFGVDNDNRSYLGMNIIPAYKEDTGLAKLGKGIVNYGVGGAVSLAGNVFNASQQALMQGTRAAGSALTGKPQNFSEMTFGKDILGAKKDNLLTTAIALGLDPATYVGGGILDDLSRAGQFGRGAVKGSAENLIANAATGQRAAKGLTPSAQTATKGYLNAERNALKKDAIKTPDIIFSGKKAGQTTDDLNRLALPAGKQSVKSPLLLTEGSSGLALPERAASKIELGGITRQAKEINPADIYVDQYGQAAASPNVFPTNQLRLAAPKAKMPTDYHGYTPEEIIQLKDELQVEANQLIDNQVNWLKNTMKKGVEQGTLLYDDFGDVIGRQGRISKNEKWYQNWARDNNYKQISNTELQQIAEKQLKEGYETLNGAVPADDSYIGINRLLDEVNAKVSKLEPDKFIAKRNIESPTRVTPKEAKKLGLDLKGMNKPMPAGAYSKTGTTDILNQIQPRANAAGLEPNMYARAKGQIEKPLLPLQRKLTPPELTPDYSLGKGRVDDVNAPLAGKKGIQPLTAKSSTINPATKTMPVKGAQNVTGNADTFRSKINYEPKKTNKFEGLWDKIRTQFVDRYAPAEKLEKQVTGKIASAESSLYKQARLFEGVPERANRIVDAELKPIIRSIENKGYSYKDLGDYAEAVHARDVNAANMQSGFTDTEINSVIQKFGTPEMETARKQLVEYSNKRLQQLVDNGVLSQESKNAMNKKWQNYMPLNRAFDDDKVEFGQALSKAFANVGQPIKKLVGSERQVIDPIESLIKNTYQIENVAGRNKVGLQLGKLADKDTTGQFVRRLADGEDVGRKNVVNIKETGVNIKYEVEPEVYRMMLNMNAESSPLWVKAMSKPASILRAGATLTPEFALRNPMRDVLNAFIVSKSGFNPITDFAVGLGSYIKKGKYYDEFLKNNGGYGNIISMDRQAHRQTLERILKQPVSKKLVNVVNPKAWVNVMRNISDATESATKIGEFRAAIRSGATPQEAAYRARDLMDFARAGSSVKEVNKVVAFLNANIQGKSKFIRAIKEDPVKVSAKLFTTMAAPTLGIIALNNNLASDEQKATIKDAPNWLRDTFWLIAIPGTDQVARIPKPFEGAAVSNTIERFMDYVSGKDKEAFDGFIMENVKQQSIPVMLSGIAPIIEGIANYSFFRESPIIPQREKYLQAQDQYDIFTSEISKGVASVVQKIPGLKESNFASPRIVENTIKGVTAGLGGYVLEGTDALLGKNKPQKNISQIPVAKGFLVNETSTGKAVDFVYSTLDKLTREKGSAKQNLKPFANAVQYDFINATADRISVISKQIRTAQNDQNLTPAEKRDKINTLSEERNRIARQAQEDYKKRW